MTTAEETFPPHRRAEDPRIAQLVYDVAEAKAAQGVMQTSINENTRITTEMKSTVDDVKDILTSFRVLGKFAKWISGIGAAIIGLIAAWKGLKG